MKRPIHGNNPVMIGVLVESLTDDFQRGIWHGLVDSARLHNVSLLAFAGGSLGHSPQNPWEHQRNRIYGLARTTNLDGIIVAGSLGNFISEKEYRAFLAGFNHFPIVTIAPSSDSLTPIVQVDNYKGMRDLVDHCVVVHSFQRFAFLGGPSQNREAWHRKHCFEQALSKYCINTDTTHYYSGNFTRESGRRAAIEMIERGMCYDVICAANDESAIGLLNELTIRGFDVPGDIAVVGFDDAEEARYTLPDLTTVAQPFEKLGSCALDLVLQSIAGKSIPQLSCFEPELVVRGSCGCNGAGQESAIKHWLPLHAREPAPSIAEALRREGHQRILEAHHHKRLRAIGHALDNILDLKELPAAIDNTIASLGIDACYIALYEDSRATGQHARLLLESRPPKRNPLGMEGAVYDCAQLVPAGVKLSPAPATWVVEPLFFRDEQYGFALMRCDDGEVCEVLRDNVGSALHSSLLVNHVHEQHLALSQVNRELSALQEKERKYVDRLHAELVLGRQVQTSLLPEHIPEFAGWNIDARFLPARTVSGDFYDIIGIGPESVVLIIADVSGKGVGAALFMVLMRTYIFGFIETAVKAHEDPLYAAQAANRYIEKHYHPQGAPMFTTLFIGILDTSTGVLSYVNAGHNSPLIVRNQDVVDMLRPTGPAIGLAPQPAFARETYQLLPDDFLVMYTDGLIESRDRRGEFFTLDRVKQLLSSPIGSAHELVEAISDAVAVHSEGAEPFDDLTLLAVHRRRAAGSLLGHQ